MKSFLFNLRALVCLVVFFAAFSLNCSPKSPEQVDANKPELSTARIEAKADVNKPELSTDRIEAKADVNQIEPEVAEESADSAAVTVNGVDITEGELQKLIKPQLDKLAKRITQSPPALAQAYKKQLREWGLEQIIRQRLLDEKVKEANIVVTEEEVLRQVGKIASNQKPPLSVEELKNTIESYGHNFDDWKNNVQKLLSHQKLLDRELPESINVTEDEAKKYYDGNPKRFQIPEQVRASHILVKPDITGPDADPNQAKDQAKAKIQGLLEQIKDGADFAELARANSTCPSAKDGGDLGFFPRGKTTPPFEKVAFELKVGQTSDVVETSYGYHIIRVTDHKDPSTISFEQAKNNIIRQLTQKKQSELAKKYIESLKAEANIVYPPGKEPSPVTNPP